MIVHGKGHHHLDKAAAYRMGKFYPTTYLTSDTALVSKMYKELKKPQTSRKQITTKRMGYSSKQKS